MSITDKYPEKDANYINTASSLVMAMGFLIGAFVVFGLGFISQGVSLLVAVLVFLIRSLYYLTKPYRQQKAKIKKNSSQ
jgi:hypothetical protein